MPPQALEPPLEAERANILLVDDIPEKLVALRSVLEELDQNIVLALSGAEALKEVLRREFAVILLDVNMPDIDGMETASLIRKYKKRAHAHTPIIFITAYADELQTAEGYALGAVDYILSPVLPEVLRSKVKVFVDLFQMQQRTRLMAEERVALARAEAARSAAEEASRRFEFLAHASRELGASLDPQAGMERLLNLVVPSTAQMGIVMLEDRTEKEKGRRYLASVGGRWPREDDIPPVFRIPLERVLREGEVVQRRLGVPEPADAHCAEAGPVVCILAVPLRIGERTTGALLLARSSSFGADDIELLLELAARGAIALENAALYYNLQREIVRSRAAEEELQDTNRRKDEFLAMLSHELRNPLAPIRNAVEVIRRVAPKDPAISMARDVVDRQLTHMIRLVDELLDVSRLMEGKITLRMEPLELSRILHHSIEMATPLVRARSQTLEVEMPPSPVHVSGDFTRLAQVVSNLLGNAAKYTDVGGRIELSASVTSGMALISVRDNGAGIEASLLPKVFDLFVQGERSLDRSQGGLGVGLTLVKRLVELHQGRVEALSQGTGKGSEFRVYLPCVAQPVRERSPEAAEIEGGSKRRVLVVDDNRDAAESVAVLLELYGHEVKTAIDGFQALSASMEFLPEAVVIDIGLPGIDGFEVARRMRQQDATRNAMLIALTGYGRKEDRARGEAAGFDAFYVKPADPREIHACIAGRVHPADDANNTDPAGMLLRAHVRLATARAQP